MRLRNLKRTSTACIPTLAMMEFMPPRLILYIRGRADTLGRISWTSTCSGYEQHEGGLETSATSWLCLSMVLSRVSLDHVQT
mmetsp:Transcript_4159/g.12733  ORF Transcript_4159/g.12733 Transcript_4159/m.12733 type:complete len:82 (+) Transcript_4159:756-1001(+)